MAHLKDACQDEVMEIQKQWECEAMRCSAAGMS